MIHDLSYICSNCDKSVFGVGVLLSSNGIQEGFCGFDCCFSWLGKKLNQKKLEVKMKGKKTPPPPKVSK